MKLTVQQFITLQKLNPQIIRAIDDVVYDAEGNPVTYDEATVQAYIDAHAYIAKRQAEYPSFIDYLDGVVKGDQAQIDKYIADCQAVKAKYPKG
jgi:hypothetical protein